jgi:hypothetical protein
MEDIPANVTFNLGSNFYLETAPIRKLADTSVHGRMHYTALKGSMLNVFSAKRSFLASTITTQCPLR